MVLAVITLLLLGITIGCFLIGTIWLAKYAFRLSTGQGLAVLLFPPYTFYFAFYKLEQETKDRPTALWMFGLVATILIALIFQAPLRAAASGDMSALAAPEEEQAKPVIVAPTPEVTPTPTPEVLPAATPDAGMAPDAGAAMAPDAGAAVAPAADGAAAPAADGAAAAPVEGTAPAAPAAEGSAPAATP